MSSGIQKIRTNVDTFGWHCVHVLPTRDEEYAPFAYTVGLVETFSHPEVIVFGLPQETAHAILSDCVDLIRRRTVLPIDEPVKDILDGGFDVFFRPVRRECHNNYLGQACRFYGDTTFDALVLFWPDKSGDFPWESGHVPSQSEALRIIVEE